MDKSGFPTRLPAPLPKAPRKRCQGVPPSETPKEDPRYTVVESIPEGLIWKPDNNRSVNYTTLRSIGNLYKLVRFRATGALVYYRLIDDGSPPPTPAAIIDAEPKRKRGHYGVGKHAWFIGEGGRWFHVKVAAHSLKEIVLEPVTGFDADRTCPWPYGEQLAFKAKKRALYERLRPLTDR